jgi:N-acylneuraminate cytidylyltransferase
MKTYAFIFARGGSKGVPQKNSKLLAGKPLISYTIKLAIANPQIEQVFVSTDDLKIAEIAKNDGAVVIKRPPELATDKASEWLAWQHAISYVQDNFDVSSDSIFISLPATSPLRTMADIDNALNCYREGNFDLVFGVTEAHRSPYFNMVQIKADKSTKLVCDNSVYTRRQDVPQVFDMTTVAYVSSMQHIKNSQGVFDGITGCFHVPIECAIDIDTPYDFAIAEFLMLERLKNENH